jgi:Na+-driven multidrug efflux pump
MAEARALLRQILTLAAPTTALSLLQVMAQLVETWLAARQGTAALAGWAVLLPFALLLAQMSTGAMGGGVVSAVARALGAQRRDEASALVSHALIIATAFGALFAVGVSLGARPLLQAVAGADAAAQATPYAWWLFGAGALPSWWANTQASVLRGGGQHGLAARILAANGVLLPLLSWLLAEPAGLGLAGVGLAFALCQWAAALAMLVALRAGRAGFAPHWRQRPQRALFVRILSVGAVASGLALLANSTTVLVTAQLRHHGPATVAAYGIAARLEFLIIPLAFGVGSALTALVGRSVGGGDWASARRIAWLGGGLAWAATTLIGAVVGLFPLGFALLFTPDLAVAGVAAQALRFTGPAFGGFGLGMAMYFASMGAGRMATPVVAGVLRLLIATAGGHALAQGAGLGPTGNFIAVALGITAYGVVMASGVRAAAWRAR